MPRAKADGTKPMMRIKMARGSSSELVFPLILMVLVVFSRTKGLDRELLLVAYCYFGCWPKCSN